MWRLTGYGTLTTPNENKISDGERDNVIVSDPVKMIVAKG
jgi:hypothetical protein